MVGSLIFSPFNEPLDISLTTAQLSTIGASHKDILQLPLSLFF